MREKLLRPGVFAGVAFAAAFWLAAARAEAADPYVWVTVAGSNPSVLKIDRATAAVVSEIAAPSNPYGIAVDPEFVWFTRCCGGSSVSKIDKSTGSVVRVTELGPGTSAAGVAVDTESVWVASEGFASQPSPGKLFRVDRATGDLVATITITGGAFVGSSGVAVDADSVWVANAAGETRTVSRIDKATNAVVATIGLPNAPVAVAVDQTHVWAIAGAVPGFSGRVFKIDKATNALVATFPYPGTPNFWGDVNGNSIAVDDDFVWATSHYSTGTVVKIDKATGAVVAVSPRLTGGTLGIALDEASVWVGGSETGAGTGTSGGWLFKLDKATLNVVATVAHGSTVPMFGDAAGFAYDRFFGVVTRADAGPDQSVLEGTSVGLDGTASQGQGLSYIWEQVAGPPAALSDPMSPAPSFTAPELPGGFGSQTLTFKLTVTDAAGASDDDTVDVTVKNVNHAPVAEAGTDQVVREASLVTLSGADSFDPDNDPIRSHLWVQLAGSEVVLSDPTSVAPTFTAPLIPGGVSGSEALTFGLTVSDGDLSSLEDLVIITVEQFNHPPVAAAGPDQTRLEGSVVTLDGTASGDPDLDPLAYSWTQVSGPTVLLSGSTTATPAFTAPEVSLGGASLTFRLVVTDGLATSEPDDVTVLVQNVNDPPACERAVASPERLWPPNHKMVAVAVAGVTDPDNNAVTITIAGVTQDEPVDGQGDGDTSPDAILQGATALLRAERSGSGNGRVYNASFTADDGRGGVCSGIVAVGVPHSAKAAPIDDGQSYDSTQP